MVALLSVSIDLCDSTSTKTAIVQHIKKNRALNQEQQLEQIDRANSKLISLFYFKELFLYLKLSLKINMDKLYVIKTIGDEIWFVIESDEANILDVGEALIVSLCEWIGTPVSFAFSSDPNIEDCADFDPQAEEENFDTYFTAALPVKVTLDVFHHATDVSAVRFDVFSEKGVAYLTKNGLPVARQVLERLCGAIGVSETIYKSRTDCNRLAAVA